MRRGEHVPVKTMLLAIFLFTVGSVCDGGLYRVGRVGRPGCSMWLLWELRTRRPALRRHREQIFLALGIPELQAGTERALPMVIIGSICAWSWRPGVRRRLSCPDRRMSAGPGPSPPPAPRAAFIPGSYAVWTLYGAWRRWPGYRYSQVPAFDDDD